MRGLALSLLLFAPCLLGFTVLPEKAEPLPASAVAAERSFVPRLAPPLSRPLRYRLTKERITPSTSERSVLEQQVVFKREGQGFVMQIRWLRVTVGTRTYDLVMTCSNSLRKHAACFSP